MEEGNGFPSTSCSRRSNSASGTGASGRSAGVDVGEMRPSFCPRSGDSVEERAVSGVDGREGVGRGASSGEPYPFRLAMPACHTRPAMVFYSDGRDSDSILRPKLVPGKLQDLVNEGVRIHWAQLNVDREKRQPPGVADVVFRSGGIYAEVNNAASLTKFIDQVLGKGITNGDCENNGGNPGGPIE